MADLLAYDEFGNSTESYYYYYYEDAFPNSTASVGIDLPQCASEHKDFICGLLTTKLREVQEAEKIDLMDGTQSAWIWTSFSIFAPLSLWGIIGNILTIIIFTKFIKRTTTSVFIISLAVVDLTVCTTSMPIWLFTLLNGDHDSEVLCKLDKLIYFLAIPLSGGILLVISLDRFILIFLMKTNVMTAFRAKIIIIIMSIICLAFAIPQMLSFSTLITIPENAVRTQCDGSISCHIYKCSPTVQYVPQQVSFYLFQSLLIIFLLLVLIFIVLYSLIFCKVYSLYKKMASWRGKHSFHDKSEKGDFGHATFASDSNAEPSTQSDPNGKVQAGSVTPETEVTYMEGVPPSYTAPRTQPVTVIKRRKRKPPHLQTALTLFLVTFCFVLAYAPMIIMLFLGSCEGQEGDEENSIAVNICTRKDYRRFIWHFYFLNHVTNPIIYSFMHPRFKEALKSCFRSPRH